MPAGALPFVEQRVSRNAATGSLDGGRPSLQNDRNMVAATVDEPSRWTGLSLTVWIVLERRVVDCSGANWTSLNVDDLHTLIN